MPSLLVEVTFAEIAGRHPTDVIAPNHNSVIMSVRPSRPARRSPNLPDMAKTFIRNWRQRVTCWPTRAMTPHRITNILSVTGSSRVAMNGSSPFVTLIVKDHSGVRECRAQVGDSLFATLSKSGVAIASVCGGGGICGLCHVHINVGAGGQIPPLTDVEVAHLEETPSFRADVSRLACRINISDQLDGATVIAIES